MRNDESEELKNARHQEYVSLRTWQRDQQITRDLEQRNDPQNKTALEAARKRELDSKQKYAQTVKNRETVEKRDQEMRQRQNSNENLRSLEEKRNLNFQQMQKNRNAFSEAQKRGDENQAKKLQSEYGNLKKEATSLDGQIKDKKAQQAAIIKKKIGGGGSDSGQTRSLSHDQNQTGSRLQETNSRGNDSKPQQVKQHQQDQEAINRRLIHERSRGR